MMAAAKMWLENLPFEECRSTASIAFSIGSRPGAETMGHQIKTQKNKKTTYQWASVLPLTSINGGLQDWKSFPLMSMRKLKPFWASLGKSAKFLAYCWMAFSSRGCGMACVYIRSCEIYVLHLQKDNCFKVIMCDHYFWYLEEPN